jgi:Flp pilus assembly protein TadG
MLKMRKRFHLGEAWTRWRNKESGFSDVLTAMIILPFMMAMIFALIEVGFNLRYRAAVDAITQDTLRGVSQDGANYWEPTSTLPAGYSGWAQWGQQALVQLCNYDGTSARCNGTPTMTCSPATPAVLPGGPTNCRAVFPYKPIATFTSTNRVFNLGFGRLWSDPIVADISGRAVVGRG